MVYVLLDLRVYLLFRTDQEYLFSIIAFSNHHQSDRVKSRGSGQKVSNIPGRVRTASGGVQSLTGSGRVGSGRVGSGRVGSGRVGSV